MTVMTDDDDDESRTAVLMTAKIIIIETIPHWGCGLLSCFNLNSSRINDLKYESLL